MRTDTTHAILVDGSTDHELALKAADKIGVPRELTTPDETHSRTIEVLADADLRLTLVWAEATQYDGDDPECPSTGLVTRAVNGVLDDSSQMEYYLPGYPHIEVNHETNKCTPDWPIYEDVAQELVEYGDWNDDDTQYNLRYPLIVVSSDIPGEYEHFSALVQAIRKLQKKRGLDQVKVFIHEDNDHHTLREWVEAPATVTKMQPTG